MKKFEIALEKVIKQFGKNILKEKIVVNLLDDYNAYSEATAFKFILKTIIGEGFMEKLLAIGKWDLNCDKLIDHFVAMTGIQKDYVDYIFRCIGFNLNWISNEPSTDNKNNNLSLISNNINLNNKSRYFLGIPFGIDIYTFINEIGKKGLKFRFPYDGGERAFLMGEFATYTDCFITIQNTKLSHKVCHVSVEFPIQTYWLFLLEMYYDVKNVCTKKYGKPTYEIEEFEEGYSKQNAEEAMAAYKVHYSCNFIAETLNIHLWIFGNAMHLNYTDEEFDQLNEKEIEQTKFNDI